MTLGYKNISDFLLWVKLFKYTLNCILKVVLGNKDHIGRLLQLILGVAINCSKQADYIQQIMEMEEEVQRLIMLAIQELHGVPTQSIHSIPVIEDDAQVRQGLAITVKLGKKLNQKFF